MNIYTYANQKGGVTKTTTAMTAALMAKLSGKRVCLIDMDPQGNSTGAMGYNADSLQHTIYTAMRGESPLQQVLKPTYFDRVTGSFFDPNNAQAMEDLGISSPDQALRGPDLLPNNILATSADMELQEDPAWGTLLRDLLGSLMTRYDEMHIDTNPSLGRLTVNALLSATHVVIPMTPEVFSQQGMVALIRSIVRARRSNQQLQIAGILFTRVRYATHQKIMARIREHVVPDINRQIAEQQTHALGQSGPLQVRFFDTAINEAAAMSDAAFRQSSVILTDPTGPISVQSWAFYVELLQLTGGSGLEAARKTYEQVKNLYEKSRTEERAKRVQAGIAPMKEG
ncbi:MAG: AAA family ATPase [Ktedonobacteraceae bacterium]